MKLRFAPRAVQDLAAIADYIRAHSPVSAGQVREAILHSLQNLILFPQVGRAQTVEGVRKLVVRKYRYLIYYTIDHTVEEIIILTIQHPAQEREHDDA